MPAVEAEPSLPLSGESRGGGPAIWLDAEYLLLWFKKSPLPVPLVTTTSRADLTPTAAIGQDGTSVLLGNQGLDTGTRQGARFTAGAWLDANQVLGVQASYFVIASRTVTQSVASSGQANSAILAVPFFDADGGAESSFVLASPSILAGSATLSLTSRIQGAEVNGSVQCCKYSDFYFDVLAGFRFVALRERLSFATASLDIEPAAAANSGLILNSLDQFNTHNEFYGCQLGFCMEYRMGAFSLAATGKLAMGEMHQVVQTNGAVTTNFFNAPSGGPFTGVPAQIIPGAGTFVQATNLGRATSNTFGVVPEVGINVGYQITDWLRCFVGYDLLFLNNVLRPGNQIDRSINVSETVQSAIAGNAAPPGTRPVVLLNTSEFWAQGVNFGIELRY
jgi:hypothetical protein